MRNLIIAQLEDYKKIDHKFNIEIPKWKGFYVQVIGRGRFHISNFNDWELLSDRQLLMIFIRVAQLIDTPYTYEEKQFIQYHRL